MPLLTIGRWLTADLVGDTRAAAEPELLRSASQAD